MRDRPESPLLHRLIPASSALLLLSCISPGHAQSPPTPTPRGTLRVLARYAVPGGPSLPTDIRWASDSSIYLSRVSDGVAEVKLADGLPELRSVLPSADVLGEEPHRRDNRFFEFLGVSAGNVMVASTAPYRGWTSIDRPKEGSRSIARWSGGMTTDLDLHGRQFVMLGESGTHETPWEDGAIAWLGSLDKGPQELQPVLYDTGGAPAWSFQNCAVLDIGAVRFLADGSFLVVAGGDPGVHLYDSQGVLKRSWDSSRLGLDQSCSKMTREEDLALKAQGDRRLAWVNSHRVLDEILPLPQGPGLLIRSRGADGLVRWELEVLTPQRVVTYALPFTSDQPYDRLRGDVRNGRIVLLRAAHPWYLPSLTAVPGELILAEVPR